MNTKKQAKRLLKTLRKHYGEHEDIDTMVIDALTELRHLCDRHELGFAGLDRVAQDHYQVEYEPIKEAKQ